MPLYTFKCLVSGCAHEEELLCKFEERSVAQGMCPTHETLLVWKGGVELPQTADLTGNRSGRFQMKAITSKGQKVAGHFGKSARMK